MRCSVVTKEHFRSGSTISLFLALFVILGNAEKPASHNQVDGKGIKTVKYRIVNGLTGSGPNPKNNMKPKSCPKKKGS